MIGKLAPEHVLLEALWFSPVSTIPPMLHSHLYFNTTLLPDGKTLKP
jgi:hypothetical protein